MPKLQSDAARRAALAAFPFLAAAGALGDETAGRAIEDLVVTASREAVPAADVGSAVTVISRDELEIRQPTFVADALRDVPGVAVSRGGGYGAVTQARIRGAEGNHTLVLIDGIEANNPVADSEFDFANLPVGDVERIEVLRGAQSALYGSDAIGGVINVITREADAGLDARASLEGGNLGTHSASLSVGGGGERLGGNLSASRLATDGGNISRFGDERDGFENEMLTLGGRARLGDALDLRANLHYIDSTQQFDSLDFEFPPTPTQGLVVDDDVWSRIDQWLGRVESTVQLARSTHRFDISRIRTRNRFFDADASTGRNEGGKTRLGYQTTIELGNAAGAASEHALTLALERELLEYANRGATPDAPENQTRSDAQTSAVAEYRRAFERASFSVSARYDDNDLFADAATYRLNASYAVGPLTRLRASLGTGVANPGFFDLFGFFPGSFVGNPQLEPERSTSFDVGVERALGDGLQVDVTYFRADLDDEIVSAFDPEAALATVENLDGRSERRGAEVSFSAEPTPRWRLDASYTYTDASQPDGAPELRRPRHVASLDNALHWLDGRARVHIGIDYTGAQDDSELIQATPAERVKLSAFTLVGVSAELDLTERVGLHARVRNLLDESYEEWFSYRGRERAWTAGIEVRLAP